MDYLTWLVMVCPKRNAIVALGQPPHLSHDVFGEYEQKDVLEVSGPRVGKEFSRISFSEHQKRARSW